MLAGGLGSVVQFDNNREAGFAPNHHLKDIQWL